LRRASASAARRPPFAGLQLLGQLVAALLAVELVLGRVDAGSLLEDLAREILVVEICVPLCTATTPR
jgi:hypothetical protein